MSEQFNPCGDLPQQHNKSCLKLFARVSCTKKHNFLNFLHMLDHYRAEAKRLEQENKAQ